ncbi:hypothetical protein pb186bvf_018803 [Paramecium bursaria]
MSHINVYVRIRPLIRNEVGQEIIIKSDAKNILIDQTTQTITQEFDKVFDTQSTQIEVFKQIETSLQSTLKGYNTTIFAYGQTGSGKTYTMFGSDWEQQANVQMNHQATFIEEMHSDLNHSGIIPRTIYSVFNMLPQNYYVYCSFLQIYNEKIYDLLQDHRIPQPLQIHESKLDGIYVEQLTEYAVNNFYDCISLMKRGEKNRMIRQTTMNLKSSRSHTIFQLIIEQTKADANGNLTKAKINLCDLAGSEKINKQEDMNQQHLLELKNINQSLTTLGKVIQNLSENSRNKFKLPIPYRESKITRLLQDSLGGNTQTHILVNIAPNIYNIDETVNSLKFAQRARNISLQVQPNTMNATDQQLVNKLMKEIDYLKSLLNMKRNGINSTDLHFKLMKMQEENERLRQTVMSVQDVEKLMKENRIMKEELSKTQQSQEAFSEASHHLPNLNKIHSDQDLSEHDRSELSRQRGMLIVSNPQFHDPRTEVLIRYKSRGNKVQTKKGFVEVSDETHKKQQRLFSERKRVIERLEMLEQLQRKNQLNSSLPTENDYSISRSRPPLPKIVKRDYSTQSKYNDSRLKIIEKQLFLK